MWDPYDMNKERFDKFTKAMGLAFKCPKTQDNPKECPMYEFRCKPEKSRFFRIAEMTDEELDKIIEYHSKCTKKE